MDTVAVVVFLAATLVVLELLRLMQRGVADHRGHMLLLLGTLSLLAWAIQDQMWRSWQSLAGCLGALLLVVVPLGLEAALRRLVFHDRYAWAERIAALREILTPGRMATGQRELFGDLVRARDGRSQEALHAIRAQLSDADEALTVHLHERIVTVLAFARRYREAATHYETHVGRDHPALHPAIAVQMVRAYCEMGEIEPAATIVQRLEEVAPRDALAQQALGHARLYLAAAAADPSLTERILQSRLGKKMPPAMRATLVDLSSRRAAAPRAGEPTAVERYAQEAGERLLLDIGAAQAPTRPATSMPATLTLIAVNLIVYLALTRSGRFQDAYDLIGAGVSFHPAVRLGQWWRLATAMFLHDGSGMMHVTLNLLNLYVLGRYLEPQLGWIRFTVIYLGAGLTGNLFSLLMGAPGQHTVLSLGASGAVFGLLGTLIVLLVLRRGVWPEAWRRSMLLNLIVLSLLQLYFGVAVPLIDNWAHAGGGFGGALLALLIVPGGLLGDRPAGRAITVGLLGLLVGFLTWSTGMTLRTSVEGTLARLSFKQQRVGPIVVTAPTYSYPYREDPSAMDWPNQETIVDPIAGFGLSPHVLPTAGSTIQAALESCMARDRQAVERRNQPLADSRKLTVEAAQAPPMPGWTGAAQSLVGPDGELLLYYARPVAGDRALIIELQFPSRERHRDLRLRALERLLASVVFAEETT